MIDMLQTIKPKSDQLNADDLIGGPTTITITGVNGCKEPDQPVALSYTGDGGKPYKPCKSMRRVLVHVWGKYAEEYIGKSMTIYCDPKVTFGAAAVGGIRISHMSHITEPVTMALTATKANRKPYTVRPLAVEKAADKAADGMRELVERIQAAVDTDSLQVITGDETVIKQRAWLASKRPELAQQVTDAIAAVLASYEDATTDEGDEA